VIESGKYPGADYNASGVVSLLQVYKTLSQVQWKHNIDFVFWDLQAYAFAGAYHYVKELKDEIQQKKLDFQGAIVLEMLGHDSKVFDQDKRNFNFEVHTSEIGMSHHSQEIALAKKIKQNVLKIKRLPINFEIKSKGFNRSDHWAFWAFQLPAILYTQNWEKDYNQKGHMTALDIPERINYRTLYQSTRFLAQGLGVWLMND
jgi:Zn-dependent M28 family amino/carboxypeptidase